MVERLIDQLVPLREEHVVHRQAVARELLERPVGIPGCNELHELDLEITLFVTGGFIERYPTRGWSTRPNANR